MRTALISFLSILFLNVTPVYSQMGLSQKLYKGGIEALEKHIWKGIQSNFSIVSDHILFFNLRLTDQGIEVAELYGDSSIISNTITSVLKTTSQNWIKPKQGVLNIVIPVFLITDKETRKDGKSKALTHADFKRNREPREAILLPPIVFTHYPSVH